MALTNDPFVSTDDGAATDAGIAGTGTTSKGALHENRIVYTG